MNTMAKMNDWLRPLTDEMRPVINLNGSDPGTMIADRLKVMEALRSAMESMGQIKPHGRDYPLRRAAYDRDRSIWDQRFAALDAIRNSIEAEALDIQNQYTGD